MCVSLGDRVFLLSGNSVILQTMFYVTELPDFTELNGALITDGKHCLFEIFGLAPLVFLIVNIVKDTIFLHLLCIR